MAAKRQKKKPTSKQPLLAKIWWATLPACILAQSMVNAEPTSKNIGTVPTQVAPHVWPLEEDYIQTNRLVLQKALNQGLHHEPLLPHPIAPTPEQEHKLNKVDVDWFAQEKKSHDRFQVPSNVTRECSGWQNSAFHANGESPVSSPRNHLCKPMAIHRVAAVATPVSCGTTCDTSCDEWHPCTTEMSCAIALERSPAPQSLDSQMPAQLCSAGNVPQEVRASHIVATRVSATDTYHPQLLRPVVAEVSHVPGLLVGMNDQVLVALSSRAEVEPIRHAPQVTGLTEACPNCRYDDIRTPPFSVGPHFTAMGHPSAAERKEEHLHLQIVLADTSALSNTALLDDDRSGKQMQGIPCFACESCVVCSGQTADEDGYPIGPASKAMLGYNRESTDIIDRIGHPMTTKSVAHLQQPLMKPDGLVTSSYLEDPTSLWLSAPHPLSTLVSAAETDCIGADCPNHLTSLTIGHPTAALAAFYGTHYRDIDHIGHLSSFTCTDLATTDPLSYCHQDFDLVVTDSQLSPEMLATASQAFLSLAREQAHQSGTLLSNGSLLHAIQKLTTPASARSGSDEVIWLAHSNPTSESQQQAPDFWSVLDHLADSQQLALSKEPSAEVTSPLHRILTKSDHIGAQRTHEIASQIHTLQDDYYYYLSDGGTNSDEGISRASARVDLRAAQKAPAVPHKNETLIGKQRDKGFLTDNAPTSDTHRFAVEVIPHTDPSALPNMHLLIGAAHPPRQETNAQGDSSLFINFAHAAGVSDHSIGYEPTSFLSVGAPPVNSYAQREEEDSRNDHAVGVGARRYEASGYEVAEADQDEASYRSEPGIDPYGRKPTTMGVRREGFLWDNNTPWLADQQDSGASQDRSDSYHHNSSYLAQNKEVRPPDKSPGSLRYRAHPIADEASEDDAGEINLPLQKKNRQIEFEDESTEENTGNVRTNSKAYLSTAASDQPDSAAAEDDAGADAFVSGWEEQRSRSTLTPPGARRDLSPRSAIDKSVAQETLFDSGVPSPEDKTAKALHHASQPSTEEKEPEGLLINFRDVGMTEYIRFVAQQTGKNFVFNDDDLQFNITIISEKPTTLENILAALLQELRIHGLQVIEQGNNIIIHKSDKTRGPIQVTHANQHDSQAAQLVTRVFQLSSIPADKMKELVVPMLSGQALVQVLADTNNLLITDFSANVNKIAELIHSLDVPTTAYEVGQYTARNNFIENLIPLAEDIIKPFTERQNIVFVPHLATNSVFIVSTPLLVKRATAILERLDTLEGAAKGQTLEEQGQGINTKTGLRPGERIQNETEMETRARLERESGQRQGGGPQNLLPYANYNNGPTEHEASRSHEEEVPEDHISQTKFYIHKLQYRQGDELQDALLRIADSLRLSEKANIDLVNAINSIQWIESSNSLVVTGTTDALIRVKELIDEIDIPLRQILLEMLILDTTISDSLTYSVDFASEFNSTQVAAAQGWWGGQPITAGTGTIASTTPLLAAVNIAANTAADAVITAAPLAGVTTPGFNLGIIGRRILKGGLFFNTMGGLVQAVHGDTNTEVVLNPKIIVEDNNEAEIFVGETIAFQTQNVVNDTGTIVSQNYEFRDVGTRLKVRPQIGNNNIITLEIEEEVSATITTQSSGSSGGNSSASANVSPGPSTSTSRTITKVHVPDGFFVVLSGMIRDQKDRNREQIPCLGGIPIIGGFCSRKDNAYSKRNLMIFIRPQIIESEWDFDDITKRQQNIYKDKSRMRPRWKFEVDEGLDFLNLPRLNERCEDGGYLPGYRQEDAPDCPYQVNWRY